MMRIRLFAAVVWLGILSGLTIPQTQVGKVPKKLLDAIVQAHGGQKALACHSTALEMDVVLVRPSGIRCRGRLLVKSNLYRLEFHIGPGNIYRVGFNGAQAWAIEEPDVKQARRLDLKQEQVFQFYSLVYSPRWLQHLRAQARSLHDRGQETYRGASVEVLQTSIQTVGTVDFLFEKQTHLLKAVRYIFPGEQQPRYDIVFGTYTDQGGVKLAKKIDVFRNDEHYRDYTVTEARLCGEIPNTAFNPDL